MLPNPTNSVIQNSTTSILRNCLVYTRAVKSVSLSRSILLPIDLTNHMRNDLMTSVVRERVGQDRLSQFEMSQGLGEGRTTNELSGISLSRLSM